MDVYNTEEEQVEAIKKWWNENGKSIIAGIIIGVIAIFGWRSYENHTAMQAKAASILYEQLLVASRKNDTNNIRSIANNIIVGFARMGGQSIGIVANQPAHLAYPNFEEEFSKRRCAYRVWVIGGRGIMMLRGRLFRL